MKWLEKESGPNSVEFGPLNVCVIPPYRATET